MRNTSLIPSQQYYSQQMYERSLHEPSGGYLQKRHSEHLSPPSIPGTRVYPYPGTTQEPVRNSYHHSASHSGQIPHHLSTLYNIGANSPHSAAVGPQTYRESNYSVDRHEFSPIDRYRNRNESNELHHTSAGTHSGVNVSTGASGHSQPPLVRRRPSLLPHVSQNEYNMLSASGGMSSPFVSRDRYELYRYAQYDSRAKGGSLQSSQMSLPTTTVSQHSGPPSIHMVQHGLHLPVGHPHQTQAMVSSQHMPQSHVLQDMPDMNVHKRPRLGFGNESRPSLHQPLLIDTRDMIEVKKEPAYTPQVEAISPTLPNDDVRQDMSPLKSTKDELLQNINKIDREILQTESQISKLRKKHQELELVTNKPSAENQELQESSGLESQLSVAQLIYSDNKAKTLRAHTQFDKLGPVIELPLYNQPSDTPIYHENKQNFFTFKKKLIIFFKKRYNDKQLRERYLTDSYDKLMMSWLKKLEKNQTNPTKKQKDLKLREYFEKQFPELRKQREDKERFSRVGQRIRSDAELEEIMDGLQEQELEDKKMRSYAVIPPILLDSRYKRHYFINRNGIIEDSMAEHKERQMLNIWTDQEKEIFRDKYLLHPKNFALISSFLERKSVSDCVQYYYASKKGENYKQLLRKQVKKRTRALVKAQQQQQQHQQAIAAQVQQAQHRPSPSVVSRQQTPEEVTKSTTIVTTTTTTTTTTAPVVSTTATTNTTSACIAPIVAVSESIDSVCAPTVDIKTEIIVSDNGLKCDIISDNEENNDNNASTCDPTHQCCLCDSKVDNISKSRAVTLSNLNLYNITDNLFKQGMRVCLMCHFKNVRRHCPVPSCKTPRRKVKRLKSLPQQWFDMSADTRQLYSNELNIPIDVRTACPRCVMRVSRRIGLIAPSDRTDVNQSDTTSTRIEWTDGEIEQIKSCIRELGRDWMAIAAQVRTRTDRECREFYSKHKYLLNLNKILKEFYQNSGKTAKNQDSDSEDFWNDMSDGDSEETSSAEEGNDRCNSDTASASSPINISKAIDDIDNNLKSINDKTDNTCPSTDHHFREDFNKLQDYKGLSASQTSLKSDYDSSATMSADEGQGNDRDNDRLSASPAVTLPPRANSAMPVMNNIYFQHQHQTVDKHVRPASHDAAFAVDMVSKVSHHSASGLRTTDSCDLNSRQKVPPFLINPNAPSPAQALMGPTVVSNVNKEEPTCVRDLIYQAIEMSLQSPVKPMRTNSQPIVNNETKCESNEAMVPNPYSLPMIKRENVIDMSKVDTSRESPSRVCYKSADIQRPEGLAMMSSYSQHLSPSPGHGSHPYVIVESDEYEVQDLSKKDRRIDNYSPRNYSPSMKDKLLLHRNEYSFGLIPTAHSNQNRGSTPVNEPIVEPKENYNYHKHPDAVRAMNSGYSLHSQDVIQCRTSPSNRSINKMSITKGSPVPPPPPLIASSKTNQSFSQLSPKMYREKLIPVSAASGGSITQGTPGIQPPNSFAYGQTRYEGLLRQIPAHVNKEGGSITLGTPLMTGGSNLSMDPNRRKADVMVDHMNRPEMMARNSVMYEPSNADQYYRRSPPQASHPYSQGYQQNTYKPNKGVFHKELQLSSNQIMIDFNTSKQMLTRRGSNSSDKEVRSSTPIHEQKISQNRMTNSYPNYTQNTSNSPVTSMPSSVYPERVSQRESQSQMMVSSEHLSHWSARHPSMGAQSPNYSRQNVIQHWNTSAPKPSVIQTPKSSSPRDYRPEVISPVGHPIMRASISPQVPITTAMYNPTNDAFTTLVNAAVAQQSLAVPNSDRRSNSSSGSRSDVSIRSNIKDKPSVEGLEKSLMEMHGMPRSYGENDSNKSDDKLRQVSLENDVKPYPTNRLLPATDDYVYALEQRRRLEIEQQLDRYNRSLNEQHSQALSQPSLRFSREPFSREQFERELRQPTDPNRHLGEHSFRLKTEDMDLTPESRHMLGIRGSELDNEASKLFSQSFQKDNQKANSSRGQFTAANLIDAIITHQINSSTESNGKNTTNTVVNSSAPIMAETTQTGVDSLFARYRTHEKLAPIQYPNREEVVTIADSPDPDKSYPPNDRSVTVPNNTSNVSEYSSKNQTLGEHIATIISKNYSNDGRNQTNPIVQIDPRSSPNIYSIPALLLEPRNSLPPTSSSATVLEGIAATAVTNAPTDTNSALNHSPPHSSWKLRKALQQDREAKESDERQIIRIVQNVSPKERTVYPSAPMKSTSPALSHYNVEPISPPTHSTNTSPQMTSSFNTTAHTTWTPTGGVQSAITNRHFYSADSSDVSNLSKHSQPVTTTNPNPNTNRTNQSQIGLSPLDYVKNRIVEVMRTTGEDITEETNKRVNNEIQLNPQQNERTIRDEIELRSNVDSNTSESVSIDSTNKLNTNCLKREKSKSPPNSTSVSITSSALTSTSPTSSQNAVVIEDNKELNETPAKKLKITSEQESTECEKVETSTTISIQTTDDSKTSTKNESMDCETTITQSSAQDMSQIKERLICENTPNISSSRSDGKSLSREKSNCEVSSAGNEDKSVDKPEVKHIYPDSPNSPNSPGEMVIDESDPNLTSSLSPNEKTDECPLTSCTQSTQQSLISTTDLNKSNSSKSVAICSSTEGSSTDVPNQSHSVSSSVVETKKNPILVVTGNSVTSAENESKPNNPKPKESTVPTVSTHSHPYSAVNSANSVTSTALPNTKPNVSSGDSGSKTVVNTTAVSSSISVSNEPLIQSTGGSSIQSSAISASTTPTSTTSNTCIPAPQYEPLSDDE